MERIGSLLRNRLRLALWVASALVTGVVLTVPSSRSWVLAKGRDALGLGGESVTIVTSNAETAPLAERIRDLEGSVAELKALRTSDVEQIGKLEQSYQAAIHELASAHDAGVQVTSSTKSVPSPVSVTGGKVSINHASVAELETLPGIGTSYAQRIIAYRTEHGPFTSIDQLDAVSGIGPATIAKLRDLVEL